VIGQLRLFDPDPTLTPTEAREAIRGRRGWRAREVMIDRQGERQRLDEQEAADDRYVPRPHTPSPAKPVEGRRLLVLGRPPGKVSRMTRSEIESWASGLVDASVTALRASGVKLPFDEA
jgi:hypothetical protein